MEPYCGAAACVIEMAPLLGFRAKYLSNAQLQIGRQYVDMHPIYRRTRSSGEERVSFKDLIQQTCDEEIGSSDAVVRFARC